MNTKKHFRNLWLKLALAIALIAILISCGASAKKPLDNKNQVTDKQKENISNATADNTAKPAVREIKGEELLNNRDARLAMSLVIDKDFIANELLNDGSMPADFYIAKDTIYQDGVDFREKYPNGFNHYDIEKAKELWAKAKEELNFNKVSLKFLCYESEDLLKVAELIQTQMMSNLDGLDILLVATPSKNKSEMSKKGEYDIEFTHAFTSYGDPISFLDRFLKDSTNAVGYSADDVQDILKSAKSGELLKDSKLRWESLQEAERLMIERDVIIAPIYQVGYSYLQKTGVKNILDIPFTSTIYSQASTDIITDGKKILRIPALSDLTTLNSVKCTDIFSFDVINALMDGLVGVDKSAQIIPKLAESWKVSEDGLKYTFYIRKDAKWSNGDKLKASDFEFAWKLLANPDTGATARYKCETIGLKNAEKIKLKELPASELGVKAIDDYTLVVELERPVPYFLKVITHANFYPVNEKFYNAHKDTYGTSSADTVYCGAYVLDEWKNGYGLKLSKNTKYYNAANVNNDGINFRVIKDMASAVNLYEQGEIDRCAISSEYVKRFIDRPDYVRITGNGMRFLGFNVGNRK